MIEHDKVVTHLSKEEKRRHDYLTNEIARTLFIKDAVPDPEMIRELRALQLKKAGIKPETDKVAEVSG